MNIGQIAKQITSRANDLSFDFEGILLTANVDMGQSAEFATEVGDFQDGDIDTNDDYGLLTHPHRIDTIEAISPVRSDRAAAVNSVVHEVAKTVIALGFTRPVQVCDANSKRYTYHPQS